MLKFKINDKEFKIKFGLGTILKLKEEKDIDIFNLVTSFSNDIIKLEKTVKNGDNLDINPKTYEFVANVIKYLSFDENGENPSNDEIDNFNGIFSIEVLTKIFEEVNRNPFF